MVTAKPLSPRVEWNPSFPESRRLWSAYWREKSLTEEILNSKKFRPDLASGFCFFHVDLAVAFIFWRTQLPQIHADERLIGEHPRLAPLGPPSSHPSSRSLRLL